MGLLSLPRTLGSHPETGKPVKASIGRFGPYVVHEDATKVYKSLPKDMDVLNVDLAAAIELLKQARTRRETPLRELGQHPADGQPVQLFEGKYGPYVKHGKVNATVPKETPVEEVTLAQAITLIEERAARGGGSPRRRLAPGRPESGREENSAKRRRKKRRQKNAEEKTAPEKQIAITQSDRCFFEFEHLSFH